jgi:inorganic pyrophosphatase
MSEWTDSFDRLTAGPADDSNPGGIPGFIDWEQWEALIRLKGITIERAAGTTHPKYADIVYPIDYGFVNGTDSADGEEMDLFKGTADNGLIAAIFTEDRRKGDLEAKLIFDCTPQEIYLINGFINFAPDLMRGRLLMRSPMKSLWKKVHD